MFSWFHWNVFVFFSSFGQIQSSISERIISVFYNFALSYKGTKKSNFGMFSRAMFSMAFLLCVYFLPRIESWSVYWNDLWSLSFLSVFKPFQVSGLSLFRPFSESFFELLAFTAGIYLLKVNNINTRTRCEICSKLKIKTPERRQASLWCLYC